MATTNQIEFIEELLSECDLTIVEAMDEADLNYGVIDLEELSPGDASELIDWLRERRAEKRNLR